MPRKSDSRVHHPAAATNRRSFSAAALALSLGIAPVFAAAPFELRVVVTQPTPATREVLAALARRHPNLASDADVRKLSARPGAAIYVTLGADALRVSLEAGVDGPLLSLFASNEAFRATLAELRADRRRFATTAVYAEPSPAQQLTLVRMLFRRRITVAVLLTQNTAHIEAAIRQAAQEADVDVEIQHADRNENFLRALNRLGSAQVLLAIPDRAIYSAESVRNVLEATYRRSQAVVGFSAALVRAGTLASVYSTVEEVVAQANVMIEQLSTGHLPVPQYPTYWRVAVNESVARSLNIPIDNEVRDLANSVR